MEIEPELRWDKRRQRFLASKIDPENGIKTTWEKDPKYQLFVRTNHLPDSSPISAYRRTQIRTQDSPDGNEYQVFYLLNDDRSVEIHTRDALSPEACYINLVLDKLTDERDIHFHAQYRYPGDINSFMLHAEIERKAGDKDVEQGIDIVSMADDERWSYLHDQRTLEENLQDLVELFGTHKGSLFMPEDWSLLAYVNSLTEEIQEKQKAWPQGFKNDLSTSLMFLIIHKLEPLRPKLPSEDMAQLAMQLYLETSKNLPAYFPTMNPEQQDMLVIDQLKQVVAGTLDDHYDQLSQAAYYDISYKPSQSDPNQFEVSIENILTRQVFQTDEIRIGEVYRYGEYVYQVSESQEGNIALSAQRLIIPEVNILAQFPRAVPVSRLFPILSTDNNIGWEQAIDLMPCELQVTEP
ncbi:hypothetical protein HY383_02635 [Candidatus Daviesbacteria bacterium]|nr:hypothetical protein [Candidatus Daviesbacteria bacterium]